MPKCVIFMMHFGTLFFFIQICMFEECKDALHHSSECNGNLRVCLLYVNQLIRVQWSLIRLTFSSFAASFLTLPKIRRSLSHSTLIPHSRLTCYPPSLHHCFQLLSVIQTGWTALDKAAVKLLIGKFQSDFVTKFGGFYTVLRPVGQSVKTNELSSCMCHPSQH